MSVQFTLPESCKIVNAIEPQVGAAITGDYVSLKNYHCCYVVVHVAQGNAAQMAITLEKATAVAPTGSTAITNVVPIWANEATATTDILVAQTAAVAFTLSVTTTLKMVVFKVDAASLGGSYDCLTVKTAASHADNITSAMYYLMPARYAQATPPSAILD